MRKNKNLVFLQLSKGQIQQLEPVMGKVAKAYSKNKPGMAIAQITVFNDGTGLAICGFIDHEHALKLQAVFSPKSVGRTTDKVNWDELRNWAGIS
jgi:hypothetical protein